MLSTGKGEAQRERAFVGRGAPQILVRCPKDIFDGLHRLATEEGKSLNLAAIEAFSAHIDRALHAPAEN